MKHINLKSIFATVLLLIGVCQVSWGRVIYLDTSKASSPYNSTSWWAHIWDGNDGSGDKLLTEVEGTSNLYQVEIGTCTSIIFIPQAKIGTWADQTADITNIPSDKNCYQITGHAYNSDNWTTYTPGGGGDDYTFSKGTTIYVDFSALDSGKGVNYPEANKAAYTFDGTGSGTIKTITFTENVTWNVNGTFIKCEQGGWAELKFQIPSDGQNCVKVAADGKSYTWTTYGSIIYTVTISAGEGGSVTPNGEQQIGSTPVTLTATPATGYKFDNWTTTGGATVAEAAAATTSVTATANGTITANFVSSSTPSDNVIYFVNKDNWQTVKIYAWDGNVTTGNWPGADMTKENYTLRGYTVYSYILPPNPTGNFQFNCGANSCEIGGLTYNEEIIGKYYYDGTWYTRDDLETGPVQNVYVQGRFRVRQGENANTWKYTGDSWGGWNITSTNIQFEYDADKKLYKLNTYCSVEELANGNGQPPFFFFTIGNTAYGAQADGATPTLETEKSTITAGQHSFQFTNACPNGENVVLYLDWENKQFWYECENAVITNPCIALYGNFSGTWENPQPFSASDDNTQATCTLRLTKGTYQFGIRQLKTCDNLNDQAAWWQCAQGTVIDANNCNDIAFRIENTPGGEANPQIVIEEDEDYIFTYTFATHTLSVTYPGSNTGIYRLVYVEKNGDTYMKFHPSTPYIQGAAEGETKTDIVSLHVRCNIPTLGLDDAGMYYNHIESTAPNTNTLLVYLQKKTIEQDWTTVENGELNLTGKITENGVYNFVIEQDEEGNVRIADEITPYTGKYYIRTDDAPGGWNNYTNSGNVISYSDYAADHRHFDHYWCKWVEKKNVKFTIANDYSNCVSDTCTKELISRNFTDNNGTLQQDANVRFMWNSKYNITDRAYIADGGNCLYFEARNEGGAEITANDGFNFKDLQNWTYSIDVNAEPNAKFAVKKHPYRDANEWYYIVGGETTSETLVSGSGKNSYTMRVVYDFKSDHLIYAWIPEEDVKIETDIDLDAAVICMRKDHEDATQVVFNPTGKALTNVHEALGVLSLSRAEFYENQNISNWKREYYWISFPFDVEVSDIFSSFVWDTHYIIQEYDGKSRAENGCWSDSPSYWRTLSKSDKLEMGKGYVLYISHKAVKDDEKRLYRSDNEAVQEINIYFPSTGITHITGEIPTITVDPLPCTITRNDRNIYDSNWHLIGVPSWINIERLSNGDVPNEPTYTSVSYIKREEGEPIVGFYYHFNTGDNQGNGGNTWTPKNVQDAGEGGLNGTFKNMYSYLVQWAGEIKWSNASFCFTYPSTQGLQAKRAAEAEDEQYTLRLELQRGEAALDQTFVRLQEDGDVTADYDMNYDMTKIINPGANLYSLIGEKRIQAGANVQPLPAENTTVYVPIGVVADQSGSYRFSMPDGTEGMMVSIADHETGMTYSLATGDYEVPLTAGTYEQRFVLEIQPKKSVTTGCEQTTDESRHLRKVLIDGNLYIQRGDALYNVSGAHL